MNNPLLTLLTLDYPPNRGGVARYLSELVQASQGAITVIDANRFLRDRWPRWWPLVAECRRQKSDGRLMLVSHVFPVGTAAWISHLWGGPEYAVLFHGLDLRVVNGAWKRWLLRRICRRAKALFVNSRATAQDLTALVPGATPEVLTPGVRSDRFPSREEARQRLGIDPDVELVVSVSRLIPRKGIDFSLRAMSHVQTRRAVSYVVVGDGSDLPRLESVARDSRCRVRWVRDASDEEVALWQSAANVFLLPVRDEGTDVEGFGIVYLEAAAAGVPAIAGKSGGAVEAVRHERTGLTVNPDDIHGIVSAVERLLDDRAFADELGRRGRARVVADFRWEQRWDKLRQTLLKKG